MVDTAFPIADRITMPGKAAEPAGVAYSKKTKQMAVVSDVADDSGHVSAAKSHFSAALSEAGEAIAALRAEASNVVTNYKSRTFGKGGQQANTASEYQGQIEDRSLELADESKSAVSRALVSLSKKIAYTAFSIENIGVQCGDYTRKVARSIRVAADDLDAKSVDALRDDTRVLIRRKPGTAIAIAGVGGFMLSHLFHRSR